MVRCEEALMTEVQVSNCVALLIAAHDVDAVQLKQVLQCTTQKVTNLLVVHHGCGHESLG